MRLGPGCGFAREARGKESVCVRAWRPAVRHCDAQGAALLSVLVAARGDAIYKNNDKYGFIRVIKT